MININEIQALQDTADAAPPGEFAANVVGVLSKIDLDNASPVVTDLVEQIYFLVDALTALGIF